jgi:hypothetical protein
MVAALIERELRQTMAEDRPALLIAGRARIALLKCGM